MSAVEKDVRTCSQILFNRVESGGGPVSPERASWFSSPNMNVENTMQARLNQIQNDANERMRHTQTRATWIINERVRRAQAQAAQVQRVANERMRQAQAHAAHVQHMANERMRQAQAQAQATAETRSRVNGAHGSNHGRGRTTFYDRSVPGVTRRTTILDRGRIEEVTAHHVSPDGKSKSYAKSYVAVFGNRL
jgi:hypothetical protein